MPPPLRPARGRAPTPSLLHLHPAVAAFRTAFRSFIQCPPTLFLPTWGEGSCGGGVGSRASSVEAPLVDVVGDAVRHEVAHAAPGADALAQVAAGDGEGRPFDAMEAGGGNPP